MTPMTAFTLELPKPKEGFITLNQRYGSVFALRRKTKVWRELARAKALAASLPRLEAGRVVAVLHFADKRRRDPHNWMPTAKAAIDGLVDAGVFTDDRAEILVGPDMRIGATVQRGREHLVLHIFHRPPTMVPWQPGDDPRELYDRMERLRVAEQFDPLALYDRHSVGSEDPQ